MTGIYRWLRDRVITPVSQIQISAENFVRSSHGQKDPDKIVFENPNIKSNDEIQELSESLVTMASDLKTDMKDLMMETKEKERIGAELSVATHIQASMLPSIFPPFPDRDEFDIYASMTPAKEVGGDFYDFFLVDNDHLVLVMADVSGKGVPASLFMVITKTLLKNKALTGASPKEILETVNNQLCENNDEQMFVTVWLGIYEISTGKLTAANAGHEYPAIRRADGQFELYKDRHGLVLAGMEMVKYKEYELELNIGDTLFVYTDGVPEATNIDEELFGTQRMIDSLNTNPASEPRELLRRMKQDIDIFCMGAPQFDDITMLAIKIIHR
jgi:sigma-B regulation protein RsbU (phosphoserine phosphatase)